MKKIGCVVCVLFLCLITGCQKTPDEVKKRMEQYGSHSKVETQDGQYIKPSKVTASQKEALQLKTQNLILPEEIHLGEWDKVYELSLHYMEDFSEKRKEIAKLFTRQDIAWEYEANAESPMKDDDFYIYDNGEDCVLCTSDNGFVSMNCGSVYQYTYHSEEGNGEYTLFDRNDEKVLEQTLWNGKDASTVQAEAAYMEQWMKEYWAGYEQPDFTYKVKNGMVYKDGGLELLSMKIQRYYEGVPFTSNGSEVAEDKEGKSYMARTDAGILVGLTGENKIEYFSNLAGGLLVKDAVEVDKVIDLATAIKLVEQELSGFKKLEVLDIVVQYDMFPKYQYKAPKGEKKEDCYGKGVKVFARPVYSFVLSKDVGNIDKPDYTINESEWYGYIDVDMQDGTIYCDLQDVHYEGEDYGTAD